MAPNIRVFALSTCIHCKKAKEYLDKCSVAYDPTYVDLLTSQERSDALAEMRKYNPTQSFPTIIIGDKVIVGFRQDEIESALGLK